MPKVDPISLTIFYRRLVGFAEEMSLVLRKTAYSPNIKERADFSCAIFDEHGQIISQADAIPVHLGSMPSVAKPIIEIYKDSWKEGDAIIVNSPRPGFGGTHLPDITLVSPVFLNGKLSYVVANRAHHADVGGSVPGSLPANSTEIYQEGIIIPPVRLYIGGKENNDVMNLILENVRTPYERKGDLRAQYSSLRLGVNRIKELTENEKKWDFDILKQELLDRSEKAVIEKLKDLPNTSTTFTDYLDYDGIRKNEPVRIKCKITIFDEGVIEFDFEGTSEERGGNCNAPFSVTQSACYYIVRLLLDKDIPTNAGCFRPVRIKAPINSVVNPSPNVATSSANTETSSRIVDVLMGAMSKILPWPSASQGTMNNLLLGGVVDGEPWSIYETIGGGTGAGPYNHGTSAIQSHMTNTQNTPIEALELAYPLRVRKYSIRKNSGGTGQFNGGDGIVREIELLSTATLTLQTERRSIAPWGQNITTLDYNTDSQINHKGKLGINKLFLKQGNTSYIDLNYPIDKNGYLIIDSRISLHNLPKNTRIKIETPGGGAYSKS